jgi:hypothetical protein
MIIIKYANVGDLVKLDLFLTSFRIPLADQEMFKRTG